MKTFCDSKGNRDTVLLTEKCYISKVKAINMLKEELIRNHNGWYGEFKEHENLVMKMEDSDVPMTVCYAIGKIPTFFYWIKTIVISYEE